MYVCDTDNRWFENLTKFNTNCYGFAINYWSSDTSSSGLAPGVFANTNKPGYASTDEMAQRVKDDFKIWNQDIEILDGHNNSPYYQTDDNHVLIALRTMTRNDYEKARHTDRFHFMVKKDGRWYFKCTLRSIFALNNGETPSSVNWSFYELMDGREQTNDIMLNIYTGKLQYIVIPKNSIRIK